MPEIAPWADRLVWYTSALTIGLQKVSIIFHINGAFHFHSSEIICALTVAMDAERSVH